MFFLVLTGKKASQDEQIFENSNIEYIVLRFFDKNRMKGDLS